ncbi:DUF536 domain-containing protein [Macrococcus brunensis]|nr:DUF536 domain-containing protein [Macrococcus brunensis]
MDNQEDEQPTQKEEAKDKVLQDDIINLLKQQLNDKEKQISFLENQMNVKDVQINKLNETLDNQQKLLHNQQALALESNDRIKALEVKLKENDKRQDKDGKDQLYVETETQRSDMKENKVDDFYKDLREDTPKGFFSKFFKR